jgi:predicted MPP superfamily phosphohydrolase
MIELLAAGAVGLGAYAGWIEPRRLVLRHLDVPSPLWPAGWAPLRVAVISDLHAAWPHVTAARIRRLAQRIVDQRPDLILLPGDFVSTGTYGVVHVPVEATAEALAPLVDCAPTYAVLGNHDHHLGARRVVGALDAVGIVSLYNRAEMVRLGDRDLWLAGVDCLRTGRADLPKALADVPPDATATILMSHIPDIIRRVPESVMLTVSGHTHGGQVRIPGLPPLITHSRLPRAMARGLHRLGERCLYVSAGIGSTGLPIRMGVVPEMAILTLGGPTAG